MCKLVYEPAGVLVRQLKYTPMYSNASVYKFAHTALTIIKRNHLGVIRYPSSQYTISCVIRPYGTINVMTSIFRFSRFDLTDKDSYGDRAPALLFEPGSLKLRLSQGSELDPNHVIITSTELIANQDSNVKVVSEDDRVTLYVNDVLFGSVTIPLHERPTIEKLHVYGGDPYHQAANAKISNLLYEPIVPVLKLLPLAIKPEKNNIIGVVHSPSYDYTITATINPFETTTGWSQYFCFKVKPFGDIEKHGDRTPCLFVISNTYKLVVSYRDTIEYRISDETPSIGLAANQDNKVRIESFGDVITLYINEQKVSSLTIPILLRPTVLDPLYIFSSDQFFAGAKGYMKDLVYTPINPDSLAPTMFSPSIIAIDKDKKIGKVIMPTSQYVISSKIRPFGTVEGWGCLFRFTADPDSVAEKYGDRNPLLMFHPGNYDLHSSIMVTGQKNYKQIYNMKGIFANQDNDVKIVALGHAITFFVNGENVGKMLTSLSDRPPLDLLYVYASDNILDGANAQISNLVFTPTVRSKQITFYPKTMTIEKSIKIGDILDPSVNAKIDFTINPSGTISGWASILRFGLRRVSLHDKYIYGDSVPFFLFKPGSSKIFLIQGSLSKPGKNEIETSTALNLNEDNKVEYVSIDDSLVLFINDIEAGSLNISPSNRPVLDNLHVYAGDDIYETSKAVIKDLVYTPLQSDNNPILFKPHAVTLKRNYKIGQIIQPSSEYIVSFTIHPLGTLSGYTSILKFTSTSASYGNYGDRLLAIFGLSNTYNLLTFADSTIAPNSRINSGSLTANTDNLMIVVARGGTITVYINNVNVGVLNSPIENRPPVPQLNVYASDKHSKAANAYIKNLVYQPMNANSPIVFYPTTMTLAKGKKVGEIVKPNSQYIISFVIKPLGTSSGWTNILRFTSDPAVDVGTYGVRNPTVWFHPDTYDVQLYATTSTSSFFLDRMKGIVENQENEVKIVARNHLITVFINHVKVGEFHSPLSERPPLDLLYVYASSGLDDAANAQISNLVFTPIPDNVRYDNPFYSRQQGRCRTYNNQYPSTVVLGSVSNVLAETERQQECRNMCVDELIKGTILTACELYNSETCRIHTKPIASVTASGYYDCWVARISPALFKPEQGLCVQSNGGSTSESGRYYLGETDFKGHCYHKCMQYYAQSVEQESISACQRDHGNKKCYVYYDSSQTISRSDGSSTSTCWVKGGFDCGSTCESGSLARRQDDYRGNISRTRSGLPCKANTYCRNSSNNKKETWCATYEPSKSVDLCSVPASPCSASACIPYYNIRVKVRSVGGICDSDRRRLANADVYVKVYIQGSFVGKTSMHYDKGTIMFNEYFYRTNVDIRNGFSIVFQIWDNDSYDHGGSDRGDDHLGTATKNAIYDKTVTPTYMYFYGGKCSNAGIWYETLIY